MAQDAMTKKTNTGRVLRLLFAFNKNAGLPLVFLLMIFLPLADTVLRIGEPVPLRENRKLAVEADVRLPPALGLP